MTQSNRKADRAAVKKVRVWLAHYLGVSVAALNDPRRTPAWLQIVEQEVGGKYSHTTVYLYTKELQFAIAVAGPHKFKKRGYLGCVLNNQYREPGETWNRGADLPDGPLTEDTFRAIWAAIMKRVFSEVSSVTDDPREHNNVLIASSPDRSGVAETEA